MVKANIELRPTCKEILSNMDRWYLNFKDLKVKHSSNLISIMKTREDSKVINNFLRMKNKKNISQNKPQVVIDPQYKNFIDEARMEYPSFCINGFLCEDDFNKKVLSINSKIKKRNEFVDHIVNIRTYMFFLKIIDILELNARNPYKLTDILKRIYVEVAELYQAIRTKNKTLLYLLEDQNNSEAIKLLNETAVLFFEDLSTIRSFYSIYQTEIIENSDSDKIDFGEKEKVESAYKHMGEIFKDVKITIKNKDYDFEEYINFLKENYNF